MPIFPRYRVPQAEIPTYRPPVIEEKDRSAETQAVARGLENLSQSLLGYYKTTREREKVLIEERQKIEKDLYLSTSEANARVAFADMDADVKVNAPKTGDLSDADGFLEVWEKGAGQVFFGALSKAPKAYRDQLAQRLAPVWAQERVKAREHARSIQRDIDRANLATEIRDWQKLGAGAPIEEIGEFVGHIYSAIDARFARGNIDSEMRDKLRKEAVAEFGLEHAKAAADRLVVGDPEQFETTFFTPEKSPYKDYLTPKAMREAGEFALQKVEHREKLYERERKRTSGDLRQGAEIAALTNDIEGWIRDKRGFLTPEDQTHLLDYNRKMRLARETEAAHPKASDGSVYRRIWNNITSRRDLGSEQVFLSQDKLSKEDFHGLLTLLNSETRSLRSEEKEEGREDKRARREDEKRAADSIQAVFFKGGLLNTVGEMSVLGGLAEQAFWVHIRSEKGRTEDPHIAAQRVINTFTPMARAYAMGQENLAKGLPYKTKEDVDRAYERKELDDIGRLSHHLLLRTMMPFLGATDGGSPTPGGSAPAAGATGTTPSLPPAKSRKKPWEK